MATWIGGIYIGPRTPSLVSYFVLLFLTSSYSPLPRMQPYLFCARGKPDGDETRHTTHLSHITSQISPHARATATAT